MRKFLLHHSEVRRSIIRLLDTPSSARVEWEIVCQCKHTTNLPSDLLEALARVAESSSHGASKAGALECLGRNRRNVPWVVERIHTAIGEHQSVPRTCWHFLLALEPVAGDARHLAPMIGELWRDITSRHGEIYIYGPDEVGGICQSLLRRMAPESLAVLESLANDPAIGAKAGVLLSDLIHREA